MIVLPHIDDLELLGVFDRGIANRERIVVRAKKATEMAQYGIIVGYNPMGPGTVSRPYNDYFFWFGDGIVQRNETVFVYTGAGDPRKTTIEGTDEVAYVVHWGQPSTLFADSRNVPIIVALSQILVPGPPTNELQLTKLSQLAKLKK